MTEKEYNLLRPRRIPVVAVLKTDISITSDHITLIIPEGSEIVIYNKWRNKLVCSSLNCYDQKIGSAPSPLKWIAKIPFKHLKIIKAL